MCVYHGLGMQINGIENLHLTRGDTARIGQITVLRGWRESAQPERVAWCITYGVHHLHILYVVYIERLLQANNQSIAIQFHGQYCVWIRVIADLVLLFEMTHLQFAWRTLRHYGKQGALEQALHQNEIIALCVIDLVQRRVNRAQTIQTITITCGGSQWTKATSIWLKIY